MRDDVSLLWILGKIHEVFSYGLVVAMVCLATGTVSWAGLASCALHPNGAPAYFLFYLFWSSVGFIPISVVCAFATKYADSGKGLLFTSDSIVIIMFGHLFEDLLGFVASPFWFLRDIFTHDINFWKVVDYIIYFALVIFIVVGVVQLVFL